MPDATFSVPTCRRTPPQRVMVPSRRQPDRWHAPAEHNHIHHIHHVRRAHEQPEPDHFGTRSPDLSHVVSQSAHTTR